MSLDGDSGGNGGNGKSFALRAGATSFAKHAGGAGGPVAPFEVSTMPGRLLCEFILAGSFDLVWVVSRPSPHSRGAVSRHTSAYFTSGGNSAGTA